jgi:hypothetical protein
MCKTRRADGIVDFDEACTISGRITNSPLLGNNALDRLAPCYLQLDLGVIQYSESMGAGRYA